MRRSGYWHGWRSFTHGAEDERDDAMYDLVHIAALLGHKSVSTTKRLVSNDPVKLALMISADLVDARMKIEIEVTAIKQR